MCRSRRSLLRPDAGAWLLGVIAGAFGSVGIAIAEGPAPAAGSTRTAIPAPGTWTIAVVTSSSDPGSKGLLQSLRTNPWVIANSDRVKLAEVNSDGAGRPSNGGSTPVLVYQQGARGPEMMGGRSGFSGSDDVVLWVRSLVATAAESTLRDPDVSQANLHGKAFPSAQGEAPPAQLSQPQMPPATGPAYGQSYLPQPQQMTYSLPMTTAPATMVQGPQQNFLIQQPPAQVMFAPPSPPIVYVPQATAPSPNLYMTMPSYPTAPMPMAMPMTMGTGPQQQPMATMPMMAGPPLMASAPQPQGVPVGPALTGAALSTSSFSVPASSTTSKIRVRGPGPVASALSRFGERLTTLGRTRIETVQETRLETQTTQTPPGQFMTLSSTSASPIMTPAQPQNYQVQPPQQPLPALPQTASPQYPQPSPQSGSGRSH